MDAQITNHFADITQLAQATFEQIQITTDFTPQRSILRLQAHYQTYRIFVTELIGKNIRQYRYYALKGDWVEAGFDNSSDPRAIRLKYGHIGPAHAGEYVPHLHLRDKTELVLTEEMTFVEFVAWVKQHL